MMFKTLKSKISIVYLGLVLTIAILGISSVINNYSLSKAIDGLMIDNYRSIGFANSMMEALEEQNTAMLLYIHTDSAEGMDVYHEQAQIFYQCMNTEANNITEPGENKIVASIQKQYLQYQKSFSQIEQMKGTSGELQTEDFYNKHVFTTYKQLKDNIKSLSRLNEHAMFDHKDAVTKAARESMYLFLILSAIAVIGGFIVSMLSINKALKPIYSLQKNMKAVQNGDLTQRAEILTDDEVGELAREFNILTKKVYEFEQSTIGKLLMEKNKSMTIVKSISDPLIVLDADYKITLINHACETLFHIREEKVINKYFLEAIRNGELYDYIINAFKNENKTPEQKIITITAGKKVYYFNVTVTVVENTDVNMNGVVVLLQNITELKQLEKMKSDFLSSISHEFKTPLTSIMMGTSLLYDQNIGVLNERQAKIIDAVMEDSERLAHLVNDLMQLIKLESGKSIFHMEIGSISNTIEQAVKAFSEQAAEKKIHLFYEAAEDLPKVMIDSEKIGWVLNNLISNALKYTSAGDKIEITASLRDHQIFVSVKDTGIGIPEAYQDKVFEKFIQVEESNAEIPGTGLGLAIAKEVVEAHGGSIWCESKLNLGTTFAFTLPIEK